MLPYQNYLAVLIDIFREGYGDCPFFKKYLKSDNSRRTTYAFECVLLSDKSDTPGKHFKEINKYYINFEKKVF